MKLKNVRIGAIVKVKKTNFPKNTWLDKWHGEIGKIVCIAHSDDLPSGIKVYVKFDNGESSYGDAESLKLLYKIKSPTGKEETVRLTHYYTPLRGDCKEGSKVNCKENLAKTLFFASLFIASFLLTGVIIDRLL